MALNPEDHLSVGGMLALLTILDYGLDSTQTQRRPVKYVNEVIQFMLRHHNECNTETNGTADPGQDRAT